MNVYQDLKVFIVVILGALLNAFALNVFLIPAKVLASGVTGIAQLVSALLEPTAVHLSTGLLLLMMNIPVAIVGWIQIGRRFTLFSVISVILTTLFMAVIPVAPLTDDVLLNAVFGGVIQAVGIGITLKFGASTGGMDIVAMILSLKRDRPIGGYMLALNGLIVFSAGFFFGWSRAMYTLLQLYVSTRVVDAIHTRYAKLTAWIVTNKGQKVREAIYQTMTRGITRIPATGGFTNRDKELLMVVITRYELYALKRVIQAADPQAFTNIVETADVLGFFMRNKNN